MALTDKLTAIGDAIREKTGNSNLLSLDEMPTAIASIVSGGGLTEEQLTLSGNCGSLFQSPAFNWYINDYGTQVKTKNITMWSGMFQGNSQIKSIPFDFNFAKGNIVYSSYAFSGCYAVESIGKLINWKPAQIQELFFSCNQLRELPELINPDWSELHNPNNNYDNNYQIFFDCNSLRKIPETVSCELYTYSYASWSMYQNLFRNCYSIDEIKRLGVERNELDSDVLSYTFLGCDRAKEITFDTNEDGTPMVAKWTNQVLNLADTNNYNNGYGVGYGHYVVGYNNGITVADEVKDAETYNALKNTENWFTRQRNYSRYNHDSAVNTINSLPDTSAYGGANTIIFQGLSGSLTDGGAINTMTEDEIAVAVAKGWTVSFV